MGLVWGWWLCICEAIVIFYHLRERVFFICSFFVCFFVQFIINIRLL